MIRLVRYTHELHTAWNTFLPTTTNGTLLLHRDFLGYHAEKFTDCSLLFYRKQKLIALLPANRAGCTLYSHQGMSYGGLLVRPGIRTADVLHCWLALAAYCQREGILEVVYTPVPTYYHTFPFFCEVALLQRIGLVPRVEFSSVVALQADVPFQKRRQRAIRKGYAAGLQAMLSCSAHQEWVAFWQLLSENLQTRHGRTPVHSLSEILQLRELFPQHIQLHLCWRGAELLAGVVAFTPTPTTTHLQYISSGEAGRSYGALDFLMERLWQTYTPYTYLSLGVSDRRDATHSLNWGLLAWKEGWGASTFPHYRFQFDPAVLFALKDT